MKKVTLAEAEKALGIPSKDWSGRCYEIACMFVEAKLVPKGSAAVYGHYLGTVNEGTPFWRGGTMPFARHGWVKVSEFEIIDPTRWVFLGLKPFIYYGLIYGPDDVLEYDEGGNAWRSALRSPYPWDDEGPQKVELVKFLSKEAHEHLVALVHPEDGAYLPTHFTFRQAGWIANLPYDSFGRFVWEIYKALDKAGQRMLVPMDNFRRAERDHARMSR